jgi:elongator complex protein 2
MAEVCPPVVGHSLTVCDIRFSSDDSMVLSVGRDRAWSVYGRGDEGVWAVLKSGIKAHARIIWGACWMPCDGYFITVSRDKSVKVWSVGGEWGCVFTGVFESAVMAVDVLECHGADRW